MELINEWQKVAEFIAMTCPDEDNTLLYMLPIRGLTSSEDGQNTICMNALCGLLYVGRNLWISSSKVEGDRVHRLANKKEGQSSRGKQMLEVYDSLHSFFSDLLQDGQPFATRIIRDETGLTT